jgi:2-hydroxy-4-(methylsulfanyl)butanoate S-methyltransferase
VSTQPAPPKLDLIARLSGAVHAPFALLAGMQLDLFTPLREAPLGPDELAERLRVDASKLRPLLYLLAQAGLLTVHEGRFSNTPEAAHYLVRGSPAYMGSVHELWSELWSAELQTAESVRSGRAAAKKDFRLMSRDELESFFRGLQAGARRAGNLLLERYDLSSYRSLADVGGGSGDLAVTITAAHPGMRATVVDLPTVTPITRRLVDEAGAADRVAVAPADVTQEPPPGRFDLVIVKALLQTLSAEEAGRVVQNVGRATERGGSIYILGAILDDSRLSPIVPVASNLYFINLYDGGQAYTEQEHRDWLGAAGFGEVQRDTLPDGTGVVIARKMD